MRRRRTADRSAYGGHGEAFSLGGFSQAAIQRHEPNGIGRLSRRRERRGELQGISCTKSMDSEQPGRQLAQSFARLHLAP